MIIKDSSIICDAPSNNYGSEQKKLSTSNGIASSCGELRLYNVNVNTTDYGVSPSQDTKLYVNGGTFQTHGHGPFYFSNGFGENYIENATLIGHGINNYEGEFDTKDWIKISSCMYMGGGDKSHNSGVSASFNNCIFNDKGTASGYFVLRGSSNEQNLSLYISNSEFIYDGGNQPRFRVDRDTDNVYFGAGNIWHREDNIFQTYHNATLENNVHNTNEIYKINNVSYLKLTDFNYKKVYLEGDIFDRTKLNIKLVEENGEEHIVDNYEIVNEQAQLVENQSYITIKYNELELQIPVKVYSKEYYDLTVSREVYNSLKEIVNNISYIEENNDKIRCIIKKEAIDSLERLDFSDIENEIDYTELLIFSNLKELDYSNKNINEQDLFFNVICELENIEQLRLKNCLFNGSYYPNEELFNNVLKLSNINIDFGKYIQNSEEYITTQKYYLPFFVRSNDREKINVKCTFKNQNREDVEENLNIYTDINNRLYVLIDTEVTAEKLYGQRLITVNISTDKVKDEIYYLYTWEDERPFLEITCEPICSVMENSQQVLKSNSNSILYTFSWNEDVYDFTIDDLTIQNGNKGEFKTITENRVYTLVVTNEIEENQKEIQKITLNENACTDLVGNGNLKTERSIIIDKIIPICEITTENAEVENSEKITYTISWNKKVNNFNEEAITIENGEIERLANKGNNIYELVVKTVNFGEQKVYVEANRCVDNIGNRNSKSNISIVRVNKSVDPQSDGPQNEEPQNEEPQNEEPQNEEPQNEKPKNEEPQNEEPTNEKPKSDEPQNEDSQKQEAQNEERLDNEKKNTDVKSDEVKVVFSDKNEEEQSNYLKEKEVSNNKNSGSKLPQTGTIPIVMIPWIAAASIFGVNIFIYRRNKKN